MSQFLFGIRLQKGDNIKKTIARVDHVCRKILVLHGFTSPLKLAPWGQTPPFLDTEWGALKKAYKMDGHKEFAWIQNGRAQSEP